jgi:hypothetical protein
MKREIPPAPVDIVDSPNPDEPRPWPPVRWAVGGVIGLIAIGVVIWFLATLTPERSDMLFDLLVAGAVIGLLSCAARYLLRAEAIRRSRLVAAELIGVTFGGAALATILVTLWDKSLGPTHIPQLVVIQLLVAVLGGAAVFLLAFFVTFGIKAAAKLFRTKRPEVEAISIGVVTGAIGGALAAQAAQIAAWFPFLSAAVCAATTYRAVVLHQRYDQN